MTTRADQIFERFKKFHAANPQIWTSFEKFTLQLISAGREHYGADAICQRIRWHLDTETRGEPLKLNDHYSAYYARMFEAKHPNWAGFFRSRKRVSQDKPAYDIDLVSAAAIPPAGEDLLMKELAAL